MVMPVWERRNYIQQLIDEVDEEKKEMERQQSKSSCDRDWETQIYISFNKYGL